jgi:CheY-like chemotaxis protein
MSLQPQEKKLILIIDDEKDVVDFIRDALEERYSILTAPGGKEALAILATEPVSLILLDIAMPEMDGIALLRRVRNTPGTNSIPVCMVTAHASRKQKQDALRAGANNYLVKPFKMDALLQTVAAQLGEETA